VTTRERQEDAFIDAEAAQPTAFRRSMIMATCMLAASMYSMNLTIVSISLPDMQGTFSATPGEISWVVTSFILGLTMTVACIGWIAERLGRKRVYLGALVGFLFASIMCGNASVLEEEVLWRFLQGASGAAILPLSQSIILDVYPREQHGRALGLWGLGNMAGPIIAPPIGGLITEAYGWQAVFYLNLPLGLLVLLGTVLFVPARPARKHRLDGIGLAALVAGLGLIQLAVNRGASLDWLESTEIIVELTAGGLLLYIFVVHVLTARDPFIDPNIFRDRNFTVGIVVMAAFGTFSFLPIVILPLFMRNLLAYPVEMIGLLLVPRALGVVIGNLAVSRAMRWIDPRHLVAAGLASIAYSAWQVSTWTFDVGIWEMAINGVFQGLGNGMVYVTVNTMMFYNLPPRHRPQGVPLFFLTFNLTASMGIAAFITYWVRNTQATHALLSQYASPFNDLLQHRTLPGAWDLESAATAAALDNEITRQASMIAFELSFQIVALVAALTMTLVYLMRNPWPRRA
jgi:DHA2 family multidrug resistance protein